MRLTLLILSLVFSSVCHAQKTAEVDNKLLYPPYSNATYYGYLKCDECSKSDIKGNVKSITQWSVDTSGSDTDRNIYTRYKFYDYKNGILLSQTDSLRIVVMNTGAIEGSAIIQKNKYGKGRLLTTTSYRWGRIQYKKECSYDKQGRMVKELFFKDKYGELIPEEVYLTTYNEEGHELFDGYWLKYVDGKYDTAGIIKKIYNDTLDEVEQWTNGYGYDTDGMNMTAKLRYANGNVSEKVYYDKKKEKSRVAYTYDDAGRLTKEVTSGRRGIMTIDHIYSQLDRYGNYQRETKVTKDEVYQHNSTTIFHRQIEYYP